MRLERTDEMKKAQSIPRRSPGDRSPGYRITWRPQPWMSHPNEAPDGTGWKEPAHAIRTATSRRRREPGARDPAIATAVISRADDPEVGETLAGGTPSGSDSSGGRPRASDHGASDHRDGTFILTVVPPPAAVETTAPRDVTLVLDRSGSMGGWKIVAARRLSLRPTFYANGPTSVSANSPALLEANPRWGGFPGWAGRRSRSASTCPDV